MNPCRCGHPENAHVWARVQDAVAYGNTDLACHCGCPEFRAAETPDTQTLKGTL